MEPLQRDFASERCPGCQGPIAEHFCPHCGERRASARPYTLHALLGESLVEVSQLDTTLLRTLRTVFRWPGRLTTAYLRGDRARYTRPVQLFLVANLAFFVLSGPLHVRILDSPLQLQTQATPYRDYARALVLTRLAERHTTLAQYRQAFDAAATTLARSLVVVMVPFFALLVALVNADRSGNALRHSVFALHFFTVFFAIFLAIAVLAAAAALVVDKEVIRDADHLLSSVVLLALTTYLARAEAEVYGTTRASSVMRGAVLAVGCFLILAVYRGVLFIITFATT